MAVLSSGGDESSGDKSNAGVAITPKRLIAWTAAAVLLGGGVALLIT
jgi:hypothetical protein